jgi:hypothetical protein
MGDKLQNNIKYDKLDNHALNYNKLGIKLPQFDKLKWIFDKL